MAESWVAVIGALAGGGALGTVATKVLNKPVDSATADKMKAEARQTAQSTAASEVQVIREILSEVRAADAKKGERVDKLEERIDKLEERERHMLTRAAVHEAWDQLTFAAMLATNPSHPPPPPLTEHGDDI